MAPSLCVVGLGLMGGSSGWPRVSAALLAGHRLRPRPGCAGGRPGARLRRRGARDLADALDGADLVVVCAPVAQLRPAVTEVLAAAPDRHGDRRRLDQGQRRRGSAPDRSRFVGGHPVAGLEVRGAAARRAPTCSRRDLVPHPGRRHRPRALPRPARVHRRARRDARWRSTPARTTGCWRSPATCRTSSRTSWSPRPAPADRRPRPARGGRRLVPRHDPRRRREPAHLGRHLPRQPRGAARRAARAPAPAGRGDAAPSTPATPGSWPAGSARPRATAAARSQASTAGPRSSSGVHVHVPDRPGVICGITQALGAARINIEDFELHHFTPDRGGTIELAVAGRQAGRRRRGAARRAGLHRDRRPGAGGRAHEPRPPDRLRFEPAGALAGELPRPATSRCPTARAAGAVADGIVEVPASAPTRTPWPRVAAMQSMGVRIERPDEAPTRLRVHGVGLRGLREPDGPDRREERRDAPAAPARAPGRPDRAVHPRRRRVDPPPAGRPDRDPAAADGRDARGPDGCPPLRVEADGRSSRSSTSCRWPRPRSSRRAARRALRRHGPTVVIEPVPTRDHTERLLRAAGVRVERRASRISVWPAERLGSSGSRSPATSRRRRRSWSPRRCCASRTCSSAR